MIPILYDKTGEIKIGVLTDTIECLIEEERNGLFELTMVYPANDAIINSLQKEAIVVADANDYLKNQQFRIYNTRKLMANRIEICARHISFDLAHDWVDSISIENQSCEYALNTIFRSSNFSQHFKGYSDIVNAQNFAVNKVTCIESIAGTRGSIIDTYGSGAEVLRDNTNIHVLNKRGHDNDVTIEYRKNLTGLEVEEDTTDLVTCIIPYATYTDDNKQEVEVRGDLIESPLIANYAHPYVKYIDYSEEFEDEVPTKEKLNALALKEYTNNKVDIPKCNYKIEFIPLSKCAGYEGLEDRINLCDVVTIKDTRYGIDTQAKVIKVTYNVLRDRYESMELGEPKTTLGDVVGGGSDGPIQGPPGPPGPQGPAGADGSIGDFPDTLPVIPQITARVYGFASVELNWLFENKVYYSYELYASKTKGFTPNTFNLIFSGQASSYIHQVKPDETWYYRACAINTNSKRTEFSDEVEVKSLKISDLSDYVQSAAIDDALIGNLSLERGWVGELKGNYIDAKQLSVTDGSGKRTLDVDSYGNVYLDVAELYIKSSSVATKNDVKESEDALNQNITNSIAGLQDQSDELYERIDEIFNDNVLSAHEKIQLKDELITIDNQYEMMKTMVIEFNDESVNGQFASLTQKHQELHEMLKPLLADLNKSSDASNAVIREKINDYQSQYNATYLALQTMIDAKLNILTTAVKTTAEGVETAIVKSDSALEGVNTIGKHFNFTESGWVEIFATLNGVPGRFKTQITDRRLAFLDNNVEVAYMSNQQLYITRAQVLNDLQLGDIAQTKTAKGGLIYQWKG